jgi:hypothetical protein
LSSWVRYLRFAPIGNSSFGIRVFNPVRLAESRLIPVTGGTVSTVNGQATMAFPQNVFTDSVDITLTLQSVTSTGGLVGVGPFFDITATLTGTNQIVEPAPGTTYTMVVQYNLSTLSGITETALSLYWWNGMQWVKENSIVDIASTTVTAHPNHFSLWGVFGNANKVFLPIVQR